MTEAVNQCGGGRNHAHIHEEGGGDPGVLGQLIYSLHPFLILISCPLRKLHKEITACVFIPRPFFLKAISSPVTTTPYPLLLSISLYSLLCALWCCHADLTPLSWAFGHQPACGEVRRMGYELAWRSTGDIWPQSNGRSHPLCAFAHSDNDSKQLRSTSLLTVTTNR